MRVYMSHWMIVLFVALSGINIALFIFWFALMDIDVVPKGENQWDYVLNSISVQITVLEVAIVVVSVFLAVLGIMGYSQIKENAEITAENTATKVANDQIDLLKQHLETEIDIKIKRQLSGEKKETQTNEIDVLKDAKILNGETE